MILFAFLKDHCHFCMEGKFDVGWGVLVVRNRSGEIRLEAIQMVQL